MLVLKHTKLAIFILPMMISGCAGMVGDFKNMTVENIRFPAKFQHTVDCLNTAAMNHGYMMKDTGDKIGTAHRYELTKNGVEKYITLDISGSDNNTDISAIYDRRETLLVSGFDGVVGYCKRDLG
ncbi:hypothetical protein ACLBW2_05015 [Enterobacteriaceae bacterium C23F]